MIVQIPDINLHTVCFAGTLLLSLAIFLCSVISQDRLARKLTLLLPLGLLIMAGDITLSRGFPPLTGIYESNLLAALAYAFAMFFFKESSEQMVTHHDNNKGLLIPSRQTLEICGMILLIVPMASKGFQTSPDLNMTASGWAQAFFIFRFSAMGLFLFGGLLYLNVFLVSFRNRIPRQTLLQARTVLLWGASLFLLSEMTGSYWCLIGWGDTWRWSENFFFSTLFYLLIMLSLHIPHKWVSSPRTRALVAAIPPLLVFGIMYYLGFGSIH